MNFIYYDIESLKNVFCNACYDENNDIMDIYYLVDDMDTLLKPGTNWIDKLTERIYSKNRNFKGNIRYHDLRYKKCMNDMAVLFGCWDSTNICNRFLASRFPERFRLVCDTDPNYDEDEHPYLLGYNSENYDDTILALIFHKTLCYPLNRYIEPGKNKEYDKYKGDIVPSAITAAEIRQWNDDLFEQKFKSNMPSYLAYDKQTNSMNYNDSRRHIWKNMKLSGRHLDIARINEKQTKVGLKRILGIKGYQILESNKLRPGQNTIETADQFFDLIAYNVSDVINSKQLFHDKFYQSRFLLKKQMLESYPELRYEKQEDAYAPDIHPTKVRKDRLSIDSSSAKFAIMSLCPYGHLTDIPTVSFMYPSEKKAKELGIKRVNVLDEARLFFHKLYPNKPKLLEKFEIVYQFYKSIEGKNFNDSETYREDMERLRNQHHITDWTKLGISPEQTQLYKLSEIPKANTCMPYYDHDGNATSCFVAFSTGGIHGAEYNKQLYETDCKAYESLVSDFKEAQEQYPNPVDLRKAKTITMSDGRVLKYNYFLKSGLRIDASEYKDYQKKSKPELFTLNDKGAYVLNKKYVYTSAAFANHEDFTSYYPNLLRMMEAFFNDGLGYDRYGEFFDQKEEYGRLRKDKSLPKEKQNFYNIMRDGTKLVLNSASGAADAKFQNNIRVNNQIISMRIIGQLFSWRIGQAQSYEGANIISTNTDGLYSVMTQTINDVILARESADIGVEIEPEPLYLISKDTNNRIELTETMKVLSASGGDLGCRLGPDVTKALAHPAIIDWALTEYLIVVSQNYKGLSLDKPFNEEIGMNILKTAKTCFEPVPYLLMMQNIIASSPSSNSYIFSVPDNVIIDDTISDQAKPEQAIALQHYNRTFLMKDGTPNTVHLFKACEKAITDATIRRRKKENLVLKKDDAIAMSILRQNGVKYTADKKEATCQKINKVDPRWCIRVENNDLFLMTASEINDIIDNLDFNKYLIMLKTAYENNWRNHIPTTNAC